MSPNMIEDTKESLCIYQTLRSELHQYEGNLDSQLQSTLVISKSKGPSKTVRDIRTSTYQICSIEEKTI